jgi:CheY-like chemotaxis protein
LLGTQFKHLDHKGKIEIRTRSESSYTIGNKKYQLVAKIDVIDNGPGIPEEKLKEIFYPMVTTKNDGMGLGLTIAQSIIMQNSGLIECSSKHREQNLLLFFQSGVMKMTNVWIIDDEESIRTICASALEDLFNVESFSSASEALLALNSSKPDLIITDIKMPGMSGLEFLDKVSEKFPDLPTIIITAHANIDNALSAYKGGAFEYLTKPFDINEIRN